MADLTILLLEHRQEAKRDSRQWGMRRSGAMCQVSPSEKQGQVLLGSE